MMISSLGHIQYVGRSLKVNEQGYLQSMDAVERQMSHQERSSVRAA
ncbi:hypothetical protein M2387_003945 [Klebsiella sp. BIGb0407]|nr:hypothetical protein [Klebsiella sp. BIGb0407]